MSEELCRCGHVREEHYTYIRNGRDQSRCKKCDPWNGIRGKGEGNFAIESGSRFEQADRAADHNFEASAARTN